MHLFPQIYVEVLVHVIMRVRVANFKLFILIIEDTN